MIFLFNSCCWLTDKGRLSSKRSSRFEKNSLSITNFETGNIPTQSLCHCNQPLLVQTGVVLEVPPLPHCCHDKLTAARTCFSRCHHKFSFVHDFSYLFTSRVPEYFHVRTWFSIISVNAEMTQNHQQVSIFASEIYLQPFKSRESRKKLVQSRFNVPAQDHLPDVLVHQGWTIDAWTPLDPWRSASPIRSEVWRLRPPGIRLITTECV